VAAKNAGDFLDRFATEFAGAFFDCTVDVVFGHGDGFGIVDRGAETGVRSGLATTSTGSEGDFMGALAEDPAFDGIDSRFDVFDL
jgi:hypothetical protein